MRISDYQLGKLSRDRLSGENYQRVSIVFVVFSFFVLTLKGLKTTLKNRLFD